MDIKKSYLLGDFKLFNLFLYYLYLEFLLNYFLLDIKVIFKRIEKSRTKIFFYFFILLNENKDF
jgi:hypothetical protein